MPRVSVVIPCYNGGAFLPGALQSLKEQSYGDFEIIIADDGSDDPHTLKVLEELDGARLVRQENKGLPAARN
ncbi:MAG TPA: glycosyltransferase, partial [Rhodospirillales bacterium]|nr:glycosyltransferase [Rhodospirillales bacterium]